MTYTGVYFDPNLLNFATKRAEELGLSRNKYLTLLVEKDKNGAVKWKGEFERDPILEKLEIIIKYLEKKSGVKFDKEKIEKAFRIEPNLSEEKTIEKLLEEGFL